MAHEAGPARGRRRVRWAGGPLRGALGVVVLVAAGTSAAARDAVRVDRYASCNATTAQNANVAKALAAARGGTLVVPSECVLVLASPGTSTPALVVPSGTTIRCESATGGFSAAGRRCVSGPFRGADCRADGDAGCGGGAGSCQYDLRSGPGARTVFAPVAGSTYAMLGAAPSSRNVRLEGCTLWTGQRDPFSRCTAGADDGKPCLHYCASTPEIACKEAADCRAGDTCVVTGGRCAPHGDDDACNGPTGRPSGPGSIAPIDFAAATDSSVERVAVVDHRDGPWSLRMGAGIDEVRFFDNARETLVPGVDRRTGTPGLSHESDTIGVTTSAVVTGIEVAGTATIYQATVRARTNGIRALGGRSYVSYCSVTTEGSDGFGITVENGANVVDHNRVSDTPNVYLRPTLGTIGIYIAPTGAGQDLVIDNHVRAFIGYQNDGANGVNTTIAHNRFQGGSGPKLRLLGAGQLAFGNYLAWGSGAYGECIGGPNRWRRCAMANDCLANSHGGCLANGTCGIGGTPCDCPLSACQPSPVIELGQHTTGPAAGTDHVEISGNVIHSEVGSANWPGAGIRFDDVGLRCRDGARSLHSCTRSDRTDCPGSCAAGPDVGASCTGPPGCACASDADCGPDGACDAATGHCSSEGACKDGGVCDDAAGVHTAALIANNHFLSSIVGIDMRELGADSHTTISGLSIRGNSFNHVLMQKGVILPPDPTRCIHCNVVGNDFGALADKLVNWSWSMGELVGNTTLDPDDDAVSLATYLNDTGDTIAIGDVVEVDPAVTNGVRRAAAGAIAVGIAEDTTRDATAAADRAGVPQRVAYAGTTRCHVDATIAIARGDRLTPGGAPGRLVKASASERSAMAVAREAMRSGSGLIGCALVPGAAGASARGGAPPFCMGSATTTIADHTVFLSPAGMAASEAHVLVPLPSPITFRKMSVRVDASIGGSAGMTVTLRRNGADLPTSTGLQCTIASGGATTCEDADAAHAVAYAAGDTFAVKLVTGAGSGEIHPSICFETS